MDVASTNSPAQGSNGGADEQAMALLRRELSLLDSALDERVGALRQPVPTHGRQAQQSVAIRADPPPTKADTAAENKAGQLQRRQLVAASSWEDADFVPAAMEVFERGNSPGRRPHSKLSAAERHSPLKSGANQGDQWSLLPKTPSPRVSWGKDEQQDGQRVSRPQSRLAMDEQAGKNFDRDETWKFLYPFTNAVHLEQQDVTEDGLPPIPRAAAALPNFEVVMLIKKALHLPAVLQSATEPSQSLVRPLQDKRSGLVRASSGESESLDSNLPRSESRLSSAVSSPDEGMPTKSSHKIAIPGTFFSVEAACCGQMCATDPKSGSGADECEWSDQFNLQISDRLMHQARQAEHVGDQGPCFQVQLHDSGLYSGKVVVGVGKFPLKSLLRLYNRETAHLSIDCSLYDAVASTPVLGVDGQQTVINLHFYSEYEDKWTIPTLEDTLRACDHDKIVLRPARWAGRSGFEEPLIGRLQRQVSSFVSSLRQPQKQAPSITPDKMERGSPRPGTEKTGFVGRHSSKDESSRHKGSLIEGQTEQKHGNNGRQEDSLEKSGLKRRSSSRLLEKSPPTELFHLQLMSHALGDEDGGRTTDWYWKERLEHALESFSANLLVVIIISVDVITLLTFLIGIQLSGKEEPGWVFDISIFIVVSLFVELTLRQIAMGKRFWKDYWNIFEMIIIWVSLLTIIGRGILTSLGVKDSNASVTLRVISRIAVGLRALRVMMAMKRFRILSANLFRKMRIIVSQNKRRYLKHGFDLDLTYITDRVIAMSAPAFGQHSSYRNDIHVVSRFLATRHYGNFFIFNLCDTYYSSDGPNGQYHPGMLFNQVQRIPFEDHGPPLMAEILAFCQEASLWMTADIRNVVAIHCKGGKGRTGVMVAALLLWGGHRKTALDALELFTFRRTRNYNPKLGMDSTHKHYFNTTPCNQTVEGPSQIRYVHYLEAMLYSGVDGLALDAMLLTSITVPNDVLLVSTPWYISFSILCNRYPVYDSLNGDGCKVHLLGGTKDRSTFVWPVNVVVWGDVRIDFYRHSRLDKQTKRRLSFFVVFNSSFYVGRPALVLKKSRIDILGKDQKHKCVSSDFWISFNFDGRPSANSILRCEANFWSLVKQFGTPVSFVKGEIMVAENTKRRALCCIESGGAEGLCYDVMVDQYMHPLGRTACEALSAGKSDSTNERVPTMTMIGARSVAGISAFLSGDNNMAYRATKHVRGFEVFRKTSVRLDASLGELDQECVRNNRCLPENDLEECQLVGFPNDVLQDFYRGLSVVLARSLSQCQIEAIRIGSLACLNDQQDVLAKKDEVQLLRTSVIKTFSLPMNEKLIKSAKCDFKPSHEVSRRMRIIIMSSDVLLDPEFYGPDVSPKSLLIPFHELRTVSPHQSKKSAHHTKLSIDLSVMADQDNSHTTYKITFHDDEICREFYKLLSDACKRAEGLRLQELRRPFEGRGMAALLESCSIVHRVKQGQKLSAATLTSSLFLICSGECHLITSDCGRCFTILRTGMCFGEVNFALGCSAGHYECVAQLASTVLEIPHSRLRKAVKQDATISAQFYYTLCLSMELQIRNLNTHAFPGTWSYGNAASAQADGTSVQDRNASAIKITRGYSLPSHPASSSIQQTQDSAGTRSATWLGKAFKQSLHHFAGRL